MTLSVLADVIDKTGKIRRCLRIGHVQQPNAQINRVVHYEQLAKTVNGDQFGQLNGGNTDRGEPLLGVGVENVDVG